MAVGIPVIASDAGAIGEVITDGQNGIMVPRTHLHQMANKIEHFLSKPAAERNEMVSQARTYVEENHSPGLEWERLESLIASTLDN